MQLHVLISKHWGSFNPWPRISESQCQKVDFRSNCRKFWLHFPCKQCPSQKPAGCSSQLTCSLMIDDNIYSARVEWRSGSSIQDRNTTSSISTIDSRDIGVPMRRGFKPPSSKRQQLTAEEAIDIYMLRPRTKKGRSLRRGSMVECKAIAPKYGVTPKTIRDIWRGRTWIQATGHLWTEEERIQRAQDDSSSDDEEEGTEADRRPSPTRARARPSASKGAPAASSRQDALHCPRGHRIPTRPCRHSGRH